MTQEPGRTQPVNSTPGYLGDLQRVTAAGGTSLSTTAARLAIPPGAETLFFSVHTSGTSAAVAQIGLGAHITVLKTTDDGVTFTDYTDAAQDGSTSTDVVLSSLGTFAQGDYVLIGSHRPISGVHADVDAANATASVLTAKYWDGTAWADMTETDNTASGGAAMAVDGEITWTVPSNWAKKRINNRNLYWVRLQFSGGLDSSTTLNHLLALPESTAYFEILFGQAPFGMRINRGPSGYAAIHALTDTGTGKLVVNAATGSHKQF